MREIYTAKVTHLLTKLTRSVTKTKQIEETYKNTFDSVNKYGRVF
jgi:hypothetical protein